MRCGAVRRGRWKWVSDDFVGQGESNSIEEVPGKWKFNIILQFTGWKEEKKLLWKTKKEKPKSFNNNLITVKHFEWKVFPKIFSFRLHLPMVAFFDRGLGVPGTEKWQFSTHDNRKNKIFYDVYIITRAFLWIGMGKMKKFSIRKYIFHLKLI